MTGGVGSSSTGGSVPWVGSSSAGGSDSSVGSVTVGETVSSGAEGFSGSVTVMGAVVSAIGGSLRGLPSSKIAASTPRIRKIVKNGSSQISCRFSLTGDTTSFSARGFMQYRQNRAFSSISALQNGHFSSQCLQSVCIEQFIDLHHGQCLEQAVQNDTVKGQLYI